MDKQVPISCTLGNAASSLDVSLQRVHCLLVLLEVFFIGWRNSGAPFIRLKYFLVLNV